MLAVESGVLEDAVLDILDVVEGWTRPMSAGEAIEVIGRIASDAVRRARGVSLDR